MQLRNSSWKLFSSAAFVLTGIGVVLPGALLPVLLRTWRLSDNRGGLLLMASWASSTIAALLVGRHPRATIAAGMATTSAALLGLAFAPSTFALPLFAFYGLGLGLTMTAVSLCRSREVPEADCGREMNRLNVLWAAGACITPVLALRSLRLVSFTATFTGLAVLFALGACALAVLAFRVNAAQAERPAESFPPTTKIPLSFCLFAALAVGLESGLGGWLTAYVRRGGHTAGLAVSANTFLWVGLLLSRAAHAHRALAWLRSQAGLAMQLLITTSAFLLLLGAHTGPALLTAAALGGLGIGPLYPSVLAIVLPRFRSNWIFFSAGVGSATLPWLVGYVSTVSGSLHNALWTLCAAVAALLVVASAVRRQLRRSPETSPQDSRGGSEHLLPGTAGCAE